MDNDRTIKTLKNNKKLNMGQKNYSNKISVFFAVLLWLFLIIRDRTIIILLITSVVLTTIFSIVFGIFDSFLSHATIVEYYNYYFIISFSVILFLIILRGMQMCFNDRVENKTMNIVVTASISRFRIVNDTFVAMFILIILKQTIELALILLISWIVSGFSDSVLMRMSLAHYAYAIIYGFSLIAFFGLMTMCLKIQYSASVASFILVFNFVINLPLQFLQLSESEKTITFQATTGSSLTLSVNDLYHTFDIQEHVQNAEILYPNLSKYLNDWLVENKIPADTYFSNASNVKLRSGFWKELGLIVDDNYSNDFNVVLTNKPTTGTDGNHVSSWVVGDELTLHLELTERFITMEELKNLVDTEQDETKKLVLTDFYNFSEDLINYFSNENEPNAFQNHFYNLYDDFAYLNDDDESKSNLTNSSQQAIDASQSSVELESDYLISIYRGVLGEDGSSFTVESSQTVGSNDFEAFVTTEDDFGLYKPVMLCARVLENYFKKWSHYYDVATTGHVTSNDYKTYLRNRNFYNVVNSFNLLGMNLMNFTNWAGQSYDDFWFDPDLNDTIVFTDQQNMFLPYPQYTFDFYKDNDTSQIKIAKDSYDNYIKPIWYLVGTLIITVLNIILCNYIFNRKDL